MLFLVYFLTLNVAVVDTFHDADNNNENQPQVIEYYDVIDNELNATAFSFIPSHSDQWDHFDIKYPFTF